MLPQHLVSEFPAPLGQLYSWVSSRPARAHAELDRADIPPRGGRPPETRVNPPVRCLGTRRAWTRSLGPIIQSFVWAGNPFSQPVLADQRRLAIGGLNRYIPDCCSDGCQSSR